MPTEVKFEHSGPAKLRSFWEGFGLTVITLGIYHLFWYYYVNDELKKAGTHTGDQKLAESSPAMSVVAVLPLVSWLIVPPLLSNYNYTQRIKRAQRLGQIPSETQIKPIVAFLLYFPGALLLVPVVVYFWYVTKHQNMAMQAVGALPYSGDVPDQSYSEWDDAGINPEEMDPITRRALKKAGRLP